MPRFDGRSRLPRGRFLCTSDGRNYFVPFALITSLFFLWGFAHSMLDVLNKHFQDTLRLSMTQAAMVQNAVYGGYFLMAIPAGRVIARFGYRSGVLLGLMLFALGALLVVPGSLLDDPQWSFFAFVGSLFVLGCGLTCLETSANPYTTILGDPTQAERRINLAQSLNGLGWILGPLVGLYLFRAGAQSDDVALPYALIGGVVLVVALLFSRASLPEVEEASVGSGVAQAGVMPLRRQRGFVLGIIALFLYVAAQTGINSFFINYTTAPAVGLSHQMATLFLSFGGMGLFLLGRLLGSWLMGYVSAVRLLAACALVATLSMLVLLSTDGCAGLLALLLCYACESIMFPTIFALALRGLGEQTKRAGSYLIMSIVGGAISPTLMALAAERFSLSTAFVIPLVCYAFIAYYALTYRVIGNQRVG